MTPREALYWLCVELGPVPTTNRDDNLSYKQVRLRDAVRTLQDLIDAQDTPRDSLDSDVPYGEHLSEKSSVTWRHIDGNMRMVWDDFFEGDIEQGC